MPENEMSPETGGWPGFIIRGFRDRAAHKREGEAAEFENAYNSTDDRGERDAIIKDAYAKDPSKVKAFVENLARRMVHKGPAPEAPSPYTGPPGTAPKTRSEAMSAWAQHGKSPEQKKIADTEAEGASQRGQMAPDMDAKISAIKTTLTKYGVSPEIIENAIGAASGVPYKKPSSDELARQDYQSAMLSGQVPKDAQGTPLSFEAWKTAQSNAGRNNGAPPKAPVTKALLIDGKTHIMGWNPETKQFNKDMGEAPPNYAQVAIPLAHEKAKAEAEYGLTDITDDSGAEVKATRLGVVNDVNAGLAPRSGAAGSATGLDKKNAMLAQSAIQQVDRMEKILQDDPNLTGPGEGQLTQLQMWLGDQDPDAQKFLISSLLGSEHGVAVFGGRNIHTIQDLNNALGAMKTNPKALAAALQVVKETMQPWLTAGGRLPAPRAAQGSAPPPPAAKGSATPAQGGAKKKWSKSAWAKANPGKDADAAAKQAQAQYEVTP